MTQPFAEWARYTELRRQRVERYPDGTIQKEILRARTAGGATALLRRFRLDDQQWLPFERRGAAVQEDVAARCPGLAPRVLRKGEAGGYFFVETEWVEDGMELCAAVAGWPLPQVAMAGVKLCRAMEEVEILGYGHRDVKPEHVLMRHDNSVVILDWGSAGLRNEAAGKVPTTPSYTPPEGAGPGSDVWAVAVTLFELLAGYRPYPEIRTHQISFALPPSFPAGWPNVLKAVFSRALAIRSAERYQSTAELREAMESAFGFRNQATRPAAPVGSGLGSELQSRRGLLVCAMCLILAGLGVRLGAMASRAVRPPQPKKTTPGGKGKKKRAVKKR